MPCRTISTMAPLPSQLPCSGAPAASGRLKDICETYLTVSLRSPNAGSPAWQTTGSIDVPHAESAQVQLGGALAPSGLSKISGSRLLSISLSSITCCDDFHPVTT